MARMNAEYDQGAQPDHSHTGDYELMPAGDYVAQVTDTDIKANSKNTGDVLVATLEILAPAEYKGRKVWNRINVSHRESSEAQRIGQVELANMKEGLGLTGVRIDDTAQFHSIPVGIKLAVELGDGKYKDKNVVKDFFTANLYGSPERVAKAVVATAARPPAAASAPSQYAPPPQQPTSAAPAFVAPATQGYAQPAGSPAATAAPAAGAKPAWMTRTANGAAVTA